LGRAAFSTKINTMKTVDDLYRWVYQNRGEDIADELMDLWDGPTEAVSLPLLLLTGFSWSIPLDGDKWVKIHSDLENECAAIDAIMLASKQGEGKYPGWEYQPLFDHMSNAHDLPLTKDEMDEILSVAGKVMARQTVALSEQNAINTPIIGEIKL
jgi:hypothetical protein